MSIEGEGQAQTELKHSFIYITTYILTFIHSLKNFNVMLT